jgi:hypothetical protein
MTEQELKGMTVNERLFHHGFMNRFDVAASNRDVEAMVQVLVQAQCSEAQALETARAVAANPKRYGY